MTKEEEKLIVEKAGEDGLMFMNMLMEHAQRQIDTIRERLIESRAEDLKRIKEMEEEVRQMADEGKSFEWANEVAKAKLPSEVYFILLDVMAPVIRERRRALTIATHELFQEKVAFKNNYASLEGIPVE